HVRAGAAEDGGRDVGGKVLAGGGHETVERVVLDNDPRKCSNDVRGERHDEAVDQADANEQLDQRDEGDKREQAERGWEISVLGKRRGSHRVTASCNFLLSSSMRPRLASSRRSLQICATYRPNASLETISELRGRGSAISTTRFTLPGR